MIGQKPQVLSLHECGYLRVVDEELSPVVVRVGERGRGMLATVHANDRLLGVGPDQHVERAALVPLPDALDEGAEERPEEPFADAVGARSR